MAHPRPQQRPPPGPNNSRRPPPSAGWNGPAHGGYDNGDYNDYYGYEQDQYQYENGGYHNQGYGPPGGSHGAAQSYGPPRGPPRPPRGGHGPPRGQRPDARGYDPSRQRDPRMAPNPSNGSGNRPPPRHHPMRPGERPVPRGPPASDNMAWDNPFPTLPMKGSNSAGLENDMAAMDINGGSANLQSPDRSRSDQGRGAGSGRPPHGSGPRNWPDQPLRPPAGRPPGPAFPAQSGQAAPARPPMNRAQTEGYRPPSRPNESRSATMPAQAAAIAPPPSSIAAAYPGQNTYQDLGQSSRPRTAGGNGPGVPVAHATYAGTQSNGAYDSSDPYNFDDVLDDYLQSPHDDEPDMPNFDAISDPTKAPMIDENLPGLEELRMKPANGPSAVPAGQQYGAYNHQGHGGPSQPSVGAPNVGNEFENAGFHFDLASDAQGPGSAYGGYPPGPPAQHQSPDALPHHPAPFRPGLDQAKPPPVRQYGNSSAGPMSPPPTAPQGNSADVPAPAGPVTREELSQLQQMVERRPMDFKTHLLYAKKLVEASTVLVGDETAVDPKTRAKNRERFITDAYKLVKRLVHDGFPEAQFYLGDCYSEGQLGLEPDPKEAFQLYQSAAKQGHAQAAYRVAVCCEIGHEEGGGTKRDPFKAVQWYKRAAALGDPPAMYKMGMILLKGLLGQARNPREGISWLKRAAERADAENPHALHELALLYESAGSNDIIIRDEEYARQLLHQAADLGYKFSQYRLGAAFEKGLMGCPVDARQSIIFYTRAAAQGEHQSELALSGWYLTGAEGILQQSDTEAYLWARKAASAGLAKAEYAMGYFTEVGIGVPSNLDDAKRWYWRAAAQGFPKARERLEELKRGGARMQKTRLSRSNVRQNEADCVLM